MCILIEIFIQIVRHAAVLIKLDPCYQTLLYKNNNNNIQNISLSPLFIRILIIRRMSGSQTKRALGVNT